jgi:hypothetical protein
MSSWVAVAIAAGAVSVAASAVGIGTLAAVVHGQGKGIASRSGSQEHGRRAMELAEETERLSQRLRAIASDLEAERREGKTRPAASGRLRRPR